MSLVLLPSTPDRVPTGTYALRRPMLYLLLMWITIDLIICINNYRANN